MTLWPSVSQQKEGVIVATVGSRISAMSVVVTGKMPQKSYGFFDSKLTGI